MKMGDLVMFVMLRVDAMLDSFDQYHAACGSSGLLAFLGQEELM